MIASDRPIRTEPAPLSFLAEASRYLAESEDYEEVTQMVSAGAPSARRLVDRGSRGG